MTGEELSALVEESLTECTAIITSERGDGRHFEAFVVSSDFVGKSRVQQHQAVYAALGDLMKSKVHALQIKTFTPDSWPY